MEKNLGEEGLRNSKELGGSARRCYVARKICLEIEGCIFRGSLPKYSRVELTTFARQSRMG